MGLRIVSSSFSPSKVAVLEIEFWRSTIATATDRRLSLGLGLFHLSDYLNAALVGHAPHHSAHGSHTRNNNNKYYYVPIRTKSLSLPVWKTELLQPELWLCWGEQTELRLSGQSRGLSNNMTPRKRDFPTSHPSRRRLTNYRVQKSHFFYLRSDTTTHSLFPEPRTLHNCGGKPLKKECHTPAPALTQIERQLPIVLNHVCAQLESRSPPLPMRRWHDFQFRNQLNHNVLHSPLSAKDRYSVSRATQDFMKAWKMATLTEEIAQVRFLCAHPQDTRYSNQQSIPPILIMRCERSINPRRRLVLLFYAYAFQRPSSPNISPILGSITLPRSRISENWKPQHMSYPGTASSSSRYWELLAVVIEYGSLRFVLESADSADSVKPNILGLESTLEDLPDFKGSSQLGGILTSHTTRILKKGLTNYGSAKYTDTHYRASCYCISRAWEELSTYQPLRRNVPIRPSLTASGTLRWGNEHTDKTKIITSYSSLAPGLDPHHVDTAKGLNYMQWSPFPLALIHTLDRGRHWRPNARADATAAPLTIGPMVMADCTKGFESRLAFPSLSTNAGGGTTKAAMIHQSSARKGCLTFPRARSLKATAKKAKSRQRMAIFSGIGNGAPFSDDMDILKFPLDSKISKSNDDASLEPIIRYANNGAATADAEINISLHETTQGHIGRLHHSARFRKIIKGGPKCRIHMQPPWIELPDRSAGLKNEATLRRSKWDCARPSEGLDCPMRLPVNYKLGFCRSINRANLISLFVANGYYTLWRVCTFAKLSRRFACRAGKFFYTFLSIQLLLCATPGANSTTNNQRTTRHHDARGLLKRSPQPPPKGHQEEYKNTCTNCLRKQIKLVSSLFLIYSGAINTATQKPIDDPNQLTKPEKGVLHGQRIPLLSIACPAYCSTHSHLLQHPILANFAVIATATATSTQSLRIPMVEGPIMTLASRIRKEVFLTDVLNIFVWIMRQIAWNITCELFAQMRVPDVFPGLGKGYNLIQFLWGSVSEARKKGRIGRRHGFSLILNGLGAVRTFCDHPKKGRKSYSV
ncbi:uncharacterized protein BDR25DRAFT_356901 [Lindgomyces ingoldianus]|uniref:Uncharacterized protein n=1 Tax=Lindgomyces ingoldianus TaxID=673940 RepID=A0ACB6QRH9_9PLEO|nr:uncharacterized protein BDR25DRAFT_356901 [Lindgomyces ingoldianus]KAF2469120.1 hypothetical protein BDR25DRAFT_356901 [Lindgomyces ingoldianus]